MAVRLRYQATMSESMEMAERINNKLDTRQEKRQKWLKEKKSVSRLTRARVAEQNGFLLNSSGSNFSKSIEVKGTKDKHVKNKTAPKQTSKNKTKQTNHRAVSEKNTSSVPQKSKYNNSKSPEKNNDTSDKEGQDSLEKMKSKKRKNDYVDPVEKLVNSTSVHIPKRFVVLVKNLPADITRDQVDEHFRKTGGVKSIRIPRDRGTDNAKGHAYIEFNSTISHRIALRLHNTTLAGRKITVEFTPNDKKSDKKEERSKVDADLINKLNMPFDT